MSLSVAIGLVAALATAVTALLGFLFKHRGAVESPPVTASQPIRSSLALFRSRAYVIGIVVAMLGWVFHVTALGLAPISLVQSVIAGGLVTLTVMADRFFGISVTRRDWIGVGLTALGLVLLAATLEGTGDNSHSHYELSTLLAYLAVLGALTVLAVGLGRRGPLRPRRGMLYAAAGGLLWGISDVTIKALAPQLGDRLLGTFLDPLVLVIVVASFAGLTISARSLQTGEAVPVIAATNAALNLVTIAAGPIVYGEPLPHDTLGRAVRIAAFALVIGATVATPGPVEAADPELGRGTAPDDPAGAPAEPAPEAV